MTRISISRWGLVWAAFCIIGTSQSRAAVFSGNALSDGWAYQGNSITLGGDYVAGAGAINFGVYATMLTVTSNLLTECGAICATWQIGDEVLGMAAIYAGNGIEQLADGAFPGFIAKWGTVGSPFTQSNIASPNGDGMGNFITDASLGSVYARLNAPGPSGVYGPSTDGNGYLAYQKDAPNVLGVTLGPGMVAFNAVTSGQLFLSVEGLLNVTRLNAANPTGLGSFTFGGASVISTQRAQNPIGYTDALVTTFPQNSQAVPEPSTAWLALGAIAAAWATRRKRDQSPV